MHSFLLPASSACGSSTNVISLSEGRLVWRWEVWEDVDGREDMEGREDVDGREDVEGREDMEGREDVEG